MQQQVFARYGWRSCRRSFVKIKIEYANEVYIKLYVHITYLYEGYLSVLRTSILLDEMIHLCSSQLRRPL